MAALAVVVGAGLSASPSSANDDEIRAKLTNVQTLIIYFSRSGNTKKFADEVRGLTGVDIYELKASYGSIRSTTTKRLNKPKRHRRQI